VRTLADIQLADRDREAIERAAAVLRGQFPVERIILYGSKARGDDDAESDIDLLVLTSRPVGHAEKSHLIRAPYPVELDLGVVLTPLVVSSEEWDHGLYQVLPLHHEVATDGVAA
jgi:predicted nucleotidyltransferase